MALSGVDQAPNQHLVSPLYGPFHQVVLSFVVVHSTSDPLVECSFIVVLSTYFPFSPQKKRENSLGGIRTPDFCRWVHFSTFLRENGELGGENHDKRTLDQTIGSGVYHYNRTHDLKGKDHIV